MGQIPAATEQLQHVVGGAQRAATYPQMEAGEPQGHVHVQHHPEGLLTAGHRRVQRAESVGGVHHQPDDLARLVKLPQGVEVGALQGGIGDQQIVEALVGQEVRLLGGETHQSAVGIARVQGAPDQCRDADRLGGQPQRQPTRRHDPGRVGHVAVEGVQIDDHRRQPLVAQDGGKIHVVTLPLNGRKRCGGRRRTG